MVVDETKCGWADCELCNPKPIPDLINEPPHYQGKVESIDAIEAVIAGKDPVIAYNVGQVIKYLFRLGKKDDPKQDAKKAKWYLERAIKILEERDAV